VDKPVQSVPLKPEWLCHLHRSKVCHSNRSKMCQWYRFKVCHSNRSDCATYTGAKCATKWR